MVSAEGASTVASLAGTPRAVAGHRSSGMPDDTTASRLLTTAQHFQAAFVPHDPNA